MAQSGRGGMGSHKHGTSGRAGHNSDMIQTNRELNRERDRLAEQKHRRRDDKYSSVKDLMKNRRTKP